MNKKIFYILVLILSFTSLIGFNKINSNARENRYLYPTVMKTFNAKRIKNYSDAYNLVRKWKKENKNNSSYKPLKKIKNGYSIIYLEKKYNYKTNSGQIYRVVYDKSNKASIYKNNKKQANYFINSKLHSRENAYNILKKFFNNEKMVLKNVNSRNKKFTFKVFKNNKYIGKYSVVYSLNRYNKIIEDDSLYQLSSKDHPKITE